MQNVIKKAIEDARAKISKVRLLFVDESFDLVIGLNELFYFIQI
jgi:hypothetical protein